MRRGLAFVLGFVCLIVFAARVNSATDRVTLAPAEFHPLNGDANALTGHWGWGDYIYRDTGSTTNQFYAQLNVPHGVIIKSVRLHYMDNDASYNIAMALVRTNKYNGDVNSLYVIWTSGASSAIQYATDYSVFPAPSYALTNTDACNYHVYLEIYGTGVDAQRVYGVTVIYETI